MAAPFKVINRRLTANGTTNVNVGFPINKIAVSSKGVVAATNVAATPAAWNISIDGRPWAYDSQHPVNPLAVQIDNHVSGTEADGVAAQATVTGVVTDLDIVLTSLNLGATATALDVQIVVLGF